MVVQLVRPDPGESDFRYVRGGRRTVAGPRGLPLTRPPYARLTAFDLNAGELQWMVPLGEGPRQRLIEMGLPDPGPLGGGSYTGPLLTSTLLFVGLGGDATRARPPVLGAYDVQRGTTVHSTELPEEPSGTPMTYLAGGRQFIVAAYGAGEDSGLIALALRERP